MKATTFYNLVVEVTHDHFWNNVGGDYTGVNIRRLGFFEAFLEAGYYRQILYWNNFALFINLFFCFYLFSCVLRLVGS